MASKTKDQIHTQHTLAEKLGQESKNQGQH